MKYFREENEVEDYHMATENEADAIQYSLTDDFKIYIAEDEEEHFNPRDYILPKNRIDLFGNTA